MTPAELAWVSSWRTSSRSFGLVSPGTEAFEWLGQCDDLIYQLDQYPAVRPTTRFKRDLPALAPTAASRPGHIPRDTPSAAETVMIRADSPAAARRIGRILRELKLTAPAEFGSWQTVWKLHRSFAAGGTCDPIHARLWPKTRPVRSTGPFRRTGRSTAPASTGTNLSRRARRRLANAPRRHGRSDGPVAWRGRPRPRPDAVMGDKAYSSRANRSLLRGRSVKTVIPEPSDRSGTGNAAYHAVGAPCASTPTPKRPQQRRTVLQPLQTMAGAALKAAHAGSNPAITSRLADRVLVPAGVDCLPHASHHESRREVPATAATRPLLARWRRKQCPQEPALQTMPRGTPPLTTRTRS